MGAVVHLRQAVEIEFGVNLGGGQVAVAEQLLYGADVAGGLQQVAGVAVAHHVRAEVLRAAVFYRPVAQAVLDLADAQPFARVAGEQGGFAALRDALRQVGAQGGNAAAAQRHLAVFAAFAAYFHPAFVEQDVVRIQAVHFGHAQAAAVEQFEYGQIAHVEAVFCRRVVEQAVEWFGIHGFRQPFGCFRRFQADCRVRIEQLLPHEEGAVLPPGGKFAGKAAFGLVLLRQFFQDGDEVVAADGLAVRGQQAEELLQIAAVGGERVRGFALPLQFGKVGVEVVRQFVRRHRVS